MIRGQMMKVEGYKISGYDATYRKALFNVTERSESVLEIMDVESGQTFLLDLTSATGDSRRVRTWRTQDTDRSGTVISFGSKGLFEKLKYSGRNPKHNI